MILQITLVYLPLNVLSEYKLEHLTGITAL